MLPPLWDIRAEFDKPISHAKACSELCAHYGLYLDDWQIYLLDIVFTYIKNPKKTKEDYIVYKVAIRYLFLSMPRQQGKTIFLHAFDLYCLVVLGYEVLHTAHQTPTMRESFMMMEDMMTSNNELKKLLVGIDHGKGDEAIRCRWVDRDGIEHKSRIRYLSRQRKAALGLHFDKWIIDEAQELTHDQYGVVAPALSTRPDFQFIFTGTPPDEECKGDFFKDKRFQIIRNYKKGI